MYSGGRAQKANVNGTSFTWEMLKNHGLLSVMKWPPLGGSVLLYLAMLEDCLKTRAHGGVWTREIQALIAAVTFCNLANARVATKRDLNYPYVKFQNGCLRAREAALYARKESIDELYVRCVLYFSAQGKLIPLTVLTGLTQLYKYLTNTSQNSKRERWRYLVDALEDKVHPFSDHIYQLKSSTQRSFSITVERILKAPLPTPLNIKTIADIEAAFKSQSLVQAKDIDELIQSESDVQHKESRPRVNEKNSEAMTLDEISVFKRGESVLRYLMSGTAYQSRSQRLGMSSRDSIPTEHIPQITKSLVHMFEHHSASSAQKNSILLALLQLSLPLPFHVLMNVSLGDGDDIKLDLDDGCIRFNMGEMLELSDWGEIDEKKIVLPLPALVAHDLRGLWLAKPTARYLADIFDVEPEEEKWILLERAHSAVLKKCSDPNLKAWPGKWVRSVGSVYSHVLGDALEAAVCGLSPRLTTTNALYYFHPRAKDLERSCNRVFFYLGLGPAVRVVNESFVFSEKNPTDEVLRSSFDAALRALNTAARVVNSKSTLKRKLDSFNECARLSAALLIFSYGGRGSKISELTNGAVYSSPNFLHVDDKHVGQERDSRLVPKTQLAHKVLDLYGYAQETLAKVLVQEVSKKQNEIWYEIAKSEYRFTSIAFNTVSIEGRVARRRPVVAADIQTIAEDYFQSSRNFMRHVIVTKWTVDHLDHNLLRVITGHATSGLEMPAGASVYSPASAIKAAGITLEKVLQTWITPALTKRQEFFSCRTLRFPIEKISRFAKSFHEIIEKGNGGPLFSKWHLAAEMFTEKIRKRLLSGFMPQAQWASVILHLIIFDGLTERVDLDAILKSGEKSFKLSGRRWSVHWSRDGDKSQRIALMQAATASFIKEQSFWMHVSSISDVWLSIDLWLRQETCMQLTEVDKHGTSPSETLLSIVTLWLDLNIPTTLQLAYAACQHAPIPTTSSSLKLLGYKGLDESMESIYKPARVPYSDRHLSQIFRIINKVGSNQQNLGELKARANQYELEIYKIMPFAKNSWAEALHLCVCLNIKLIRSNNKKRIKFSSMSTYLKYLRAVLIEFSECPITEFTEFDFFDLAKALRSVVDKQQEYERKITKVQRCEDQDSAANWLLKSLKSIGYPVPDAALTESNEHLMTPSAVTSISHVTDVELQTAKEMSQQWDCEDSLRVARLDSAISLLSEVPLRWMECAALTSSSLLIRTPGIRIKPSGLSHIKSASGHRVLPIKTELQSKLVKLRSRISALKFGENLDPFLFLDDRKEKSIGSSSAWLHRSITSALSYSAGEEGFRIHHLRARAISARMFVDWEQTLDEWGLHKQGPAHLKKYFEYTPAKAWRVDEARILAGHAHPNTTVLYYLYPHHFLRAMALASLLASTQPSEAMWQRVEARSGNDGRIARNTSSRRDTWLHFSKLLYSEHVDDKLPVLTQAKVSSLVSKRNSNELTTHIKVFDGVVYLYLRILERETSNALDISRVSVSQGQFLEQILKKLRKLPIFRSVATWLNESDTKDREATARCYNSPHFESLFSTLCQRSSSDLQSLSCLFGGVTPINNLTESLFNAAGIFNSSEFCLEVINDARYVDQELNVRLRQHQSIRIGVYIKRQGKRPAIYLVQRNDRMSRLARRRLQRILLILLVSLYGLTHLNESALNGNK